MFKSTLIGIFSALLSAFAAGDPLTVYTHSGPIVGVAQKAFPNNVSYISFKGVPYAEPPVAELRFKVPVPVKPWTQPLVTSDQFQPSCFWTDGSGSAPTQANQSENCLFLNIYTPVMCQDKTNKKLPVLLNIHGGGFAVGDGTDANYGPDFIVQENVILVSINYRLGPFGFTNFELEGYTGNMGLKDQRLAIKWIKANIGYFGGDPDSITIFGESSGGTAVHFHVLSDTCEMISRAIIWSGDAFSSDAHYEKNNHVDLLKDAFNLTNKATKADLLNFMKNASPDLIVEKTPQPPAKTVFGIYFSPVVEDESIAVEPILTRTPHEIYAKNEFSSHCKNVQVSFGVTSAEYLLFLDFGDLYNWMESLKNNSNIGLPFQGLNITESDEVYQKMQAEIKKFYFGDDEIKATPERLNQFVQMATDTNFLPQLYEGMRLHSNVSPTFCNIFDISLNMNIAKVPYHLEMIEGMGHFEDIQYMFKAKDYATDYQKVYDNQKNNITDQMTVDAWQFVTKLFTDFAKTGVLQHSSPVKPTGDVQCVDIGNEGLRTIVQPKREAIAFWDQIKKNVQKYIVNEF